MGQSKAYSIFTNSTPCFILQANFIMVNKTFNQIYLY